MCRPPTSDPELSGSDYGAKKLSKEDEWMGKFDMDAFKADVSAVGKQFAQNQGPEDTRHLNKIIMWSRACQWTGLLTMPFSVNPITMFLLSMGTMTRWTIIGHHICHGGFDKCSNGVYNRFKFGVGSLYRRTVDWLDWMLVEAWNCEHNQIHHYSLGEVADPDLVEHNMEYLRQLDAPKPLKYVGVVWMILTWKWWYYAPNTYKQLKQNERRRAGLPPISEGLAVHAPCTVFGEVFGRDFAPMDFFMRVLFPYFLVRFVLGPAAVGLALGWPAARICCFNLIGGELMTNAHSFLNIATNHAGDDLYRFNRHCAPRSGTFYLRQVLSSVNFATGSDLVDFTHGWLNYQIEHHLFPDLSMLSYQRMQPVVQAICEKHGVPYLKQSVLWRLKKTVDIMVGNGSMRKFPDAYENEADLSTQ